MRHVYTSRRPGSDFSQESGGRMHSTTSGIPTVDRPSYLLARRANVPLYHQIRAFLREQIHNGERKSGDQLPSEDELGREFRVTRMTVRQAISGLVSEGLVYRR